MPDPVTQNYYVIAHHDSWPVVHFSILPNRAEALADIEKLLNEASPDVVDEINIHLIQGTELSVSAPRRTIMVGIEAVSHVILPETGKLTPVVAPPK